MTNDHSAVSPKKPTGSEAGQHTCPGTRPRMSEGQKERPAPSEAIPETQPLRMPRYQRFDISKGMLMILVVFGHGIQFIGYHDRQDFWSDPLFMAIYMFHMPLFMAYSGYFAPLRPLTLHDLASRARILIYPMLPWALIFAVLRGVSGGTPEMIPEMTVTGFFTIYWFLWAAFLCLLLLWAGQKAGHWKPLVYGMVLAGLMTISIPWSILPMLAFTLPFFLGGHYIRVSSPLSFRSLLLLTLSGAIVAAFCYLAWDDMTYIYNNRARILAHPQEVVLMFIGAIAATIGAATFLNRLSSRLEGTVFGHWISRIGQVTLEIYLVQGVIFAASGVFGGYLPGEGSDWILLRWLAAASFSLVLTVTLLILIETTRRGPLLSKLLWGR